MENVIELIRAERVRQNAKWGEQNHDDYRWLAILTEEVGELAESILHNEFGGHAAGNTQTELVHVAAVAVQWLECMERRLTMCGADGDYCSRSDPGGTYIVSEQRYCWDCHRPRRSH